MPQMAPMNWLILFFFFFALFIIFNSMNFFSFLYTIKSEQMTKKKSTYNWKW
uniref:ATP synthase F0 subunit 8 n=1 Tax=Allotraeus orientalis TaxID=2690021 RepID=UPI001F147275|nr:ATP synthase F0 subunit 8 [Allotraeus orientalis]UKQ56279.1 ATP synthase F0 subunit 8 [Allotraeus orientalis]